jgi:ubiquinol-cytochrome c reductase iron-sulfur subunit
MTNTLNPETVGSVNPDACPDSGRRNLLVAATAVVGAAGFAAASIPFVVSMAPSERARAGGAPVDADFAKLDPGEQVTFEWRGKPLWILRRTGAMLKALESPAHRAKLADPDSRVKEQQPAYARNAFRSTKPEYLVLVPICTHLGCVPTFRPDVAPRDLGSEWPGGYFCPCHGSKFDFAGRVYRNVPAPTNLVVPPHRYLSAAMVRVGEHPERIT